MRDRRLGRFRVSAQFLDDARDGMGANLFRDIIPLDVQRDFESEITTYLAWHPSFEKVPEGQIIPEYEAIFSATSATPTWRRCSDTTGAKP